MHVTSGWHELLNPPGLFRIYVCSDEKYSLPMFLVKTSMQNICSEEELTAAGDHHCKWIRAFTSVSKTPQSSRTRRLQYMAGRFGWWTKRGRLEENNSKRRVNISGTLIVNTYSRFYFTPRRLLMSLLAYNLCWECGTKAGSFLHVLWGM